jgi:hypothetical protein
MEQVMQHLNTEYTVKQITVTDDTGETVAIIKYDDDRYCLYTLLNIDRPNGQYWIMGLQQPHGRYREHEVAEYAALVWYNHVYLEGI